MIIIQFLLLGLLKIAKDDFFQNEEKTRASLPNGDYTCWALDSGQDYGKAYGLFKIITGDPRARIIHGGGSNEKVIPDPFALNQGWLGTFGCLRMQNGDGMMLSWMMISNGNSMQLHVGDSFRSTM